MSFWDILPIFSLFIAVVVEVFVFNNISTGLTSTVSNSTSNQTMNDLLNATDTPFGSILTLLPIIAIVMISGIVLSTVMSFGGSSDSDEKVVEEDEEPEPEPVRVKRKDAERILMERFARGEISSEEYSDRMSRL